MKLLACLLLACALAAGSCMSEMRASPERPQQRH
jgi:hypothetical protein